MSKVKKELRLENVKIKNRLNKAIYIKKVKGEFMNNKIALFCHRGLYGCTDINPDFLSMPYAKGPDLKNIPPENTYTSIKAAFDNGFGVELDVCMTKDNVIIVTHTNHLSLHVKEASPNDCVSTMYFNDIMPMKTGIAGKTEKILTYEEFLNLFNNYPELNVNVEIKGTIEPIDAMQPQNNPSLVEQLSKITPEKLKRKIIWSSFSTEMLHDLKKLNPKAEIAQLFCEKASSEPLIFANKTDRYWQFNLKNIEKIMNIVPISAAHVEISTLKDDEALLFCINNNIRIRTWALHERNPNKDINAYKNIVKVKQLKTKYPLLHIDIITDYASVIENIL